jgi:hypothetical protein
MRIALRAPEYLPSLDVMALYAYADTVVLADHLQYSRQSRQNRTRIRNPEGAQWLTVPLAGGQFGLPVREVRIDNRDAWAGRHLRAVRFNYQTAPYFDFYYDGLERLLRRPWTFLGDLTSETIGLLCGWMAIQSRRVIASSVSADLHSPSVAASSLNGRNIALPDTGNIDRERGHDVEIVTLEEAKRHQNFPGFVPGISALDAVMNYGPSAVRFLEPLTDRGGNTD